MDERITTYSTLWSIVDIDTKEHKLKQITTLLLEAMNDWTRTNTEDIYKFVKDIEEYFGKPLTIEKIKKIQFNGYNAWELEAGSSLVELIEISTEFYRETNFYTILENVLDY